MLKNIDKALENFSECLKSAIIETPAPNTKSLKIVKKLKFRVYFKLPTVDERNGLRIGLFENEIILKSYTILVKLKLKKN